MKTIRRDWLKKQIEKGNVEAKCNYIMTDDYAFDDAYNCQRTGWKPARISNPTWKEVTLQNGITQTVQDSDDLKDGYTNFRDYDFTMSTGRAYWNEDETISFCPLSSEYYTLRIVK